MSLLKANYCRSIMGTASIATSAEAIRLIYGLTTERLSLETTPDVLDAEVAALNAIHKLSESLAGRSAAVGGFEWTRACHAIDRWIIAAM